MCQDLISTESQEFTVVTRLAPFGNAFAHLTYSDDDLAFIFGARTRAGAGAGVGRRADRRPPGPVLEEPALVVRLAPAVGEDDRDVRDDDRADGRNQGKPSRDAAANVFFAHLAALHKNPPGRHWLAPHYAFQELAASRPHEPVDPDNLPGAD